MIAYFIFNVNCFILKYVLKLGCWNDLPSSNNSLSTFKNKNFSYHFENNISFGENGS